MGAGEFLTVFIHLRVHSAYSLAEGAIKVKDLAKLCLKHQMPAVGIADTSNLFGALEFAVTLSSSGIQPIVGCQVAVKVEGLSDPHPLVLIAQNEQGYKNLMALVTQLHLASPPDEIAHVTLETLAPLTDGLLALTGGTDGLLGMLIQKGDLGAANELFLKLKTLFPERLYIELMRHGLPQEAITEPVFLEMADTYHTPLVATNHVFFDKPEMFEAHDALLCVAASTYVAETKRRRLTDQHYFKTAAEMKALFADIPEAIDNTVQIAKRCAFMPRPHAPILPAYPVTGGRTEAEELRYKAETGLEKRLVTQVYAPDASEDDKDRQRTIYIDRLNHELAIIEKMGFPGYFLIVADFIQWAKAQSIPVGPGRGSGAGSLVAWALTITDIDPIRFSLLFERFLNPERVSMPDFDVDFCQDRRDEVIAYVCRKYGADRVAHIITFGKLQARAVLRDVGRVLQMPYGQVDKICKLIPNNPANPVSLEQALILEPALQSARQQDATVGTLIDMGMRLEGLYRHASTHAAGVVIGDRPLQELVPLYKDERSALPATQFSMKYAEMAGLVKFDFLGLKTLTVIENCCKMARARGIDLNISDIPLDDPKTFDLLCRVETVGVFQVESAGMRDVLRKLRPDRFEDLIALVALYRPGPMDDIPRYLACKHGEEPVTYLHPALQPILEGTYGVMVYQEQVMQIAQVLGGYTLGAADLLRRAMGKKIKAEMDAQCDLFVSGAIKNGVKKEIATQIFEQMAKFAGYGFNKSHSAPYALLTYQTAYLKANYPLEFYAASMTCDMHNTDKLNVFRQDMVALGYTLLPPDVNTSEVEFAVEDHKAVRYALAAIKNVGATGMEHLVSDRQKNGPFRTIADFATRLEHRTVNKRQLENLVAAGALDAVEPNRHRIYAGIDLVLRHAQTVTQEKNSRQASLFGFDARGAHAQLTLPAAHPWGALEELQKEFDALGFFFSAHPLDVYGSLIGGLGICSTASLKEQSDGSRIKIAGVLLVKQERTSKTGNKFAFVQLSDTYGICEVAVFGDVFVKNRDHLIPGKALCISALIRFEGEDCRLIAQGIDFLDDLVSKTTAPVSVHVGDALCAETFSQILDACASGPIVLTCVVHVCDKRRVMIQLPRSIQLGVDARSKLLKTPGVLLIEEKY